MLSTDRWKDMFRRQAEFMEMLKEAGKFPEFPFDLTTKEGQRAIKEVVYNLKCELWEAVYTLKNKMHRITDDTEIDRQHFKEEMGDALAFFMEVCIAADLSDEEMYEELCRKNQIVKERLKNGY